jgi:hypothetical protein
MARGDCFKRSHAVPCSECRSLLPFWIIFLQLMSSMHSIVVSRGGKQQTRHFSNSTTSNDKKQAIAGTCVAHYYNNYELAKRRTYYFSTKTRTCQPASQPATASSSMHACMGTKWKYNMWSESVSLNISKANDTMRMEMLQTVPGTILKQ